MFVAAAVSLAAFIANPMFAQSQAEGVKKDIALQLYSLRDMFKKDYEAAMKVVGEMGYTAVEAAGYSDGKFYGQTPEKFKADVEKYGMKVLSSHTSKALSDKELKTKDFSWSNQNGFQILIQKLQVLLMISIEFKMSKSIICTILCQEFQIS